MIEYFFFGLTEIDSLGKCHIWHSSKLFLPRQWSSEESSYRGIKVARHVTEDTSCLTSYFSFFLPTSSIPYVVSRVYHCRFTMLHMQASFCQANQFGTKQPRKTYTQHWICGFLFFGRFTLGVVIKHTSWLLFITRRYLLSLFFLPRHIVIVQLCSQSISIKSSDCRLMSICIGPMRVGLSYRLHVFNCILQIDDNVLVVQFQFILPNAHPNRFVRCDTSGAIHWLYSRRKKCKFRVCDTKRGIQRGGL